MTYEKQNWSTGQTITAEKLNHMEDGIVGGGSGGSGVLGVSIIREETSEHLDKTWNEIATALSNGGIVSVKIEGNYPEEFYYGLIRNTGKAVNKQTGETMYGVIYWGPDSTFDNFEYVSYVTNSPDGYPTWVYE